MFRKGEKPGYTEKVFDVAVILENINNKIQLRGVMFIFTKYIGLYMSKVTLYMLAHLEMKLLIFPMTAFGETSKTVKTFDQKDVGL